MLLGAYFLPLHIQLEEQPRQAAVLELPGEPSHDLMVRADCHSQIKSPSRECDSFGKPEKLLPDFRHPSAKVQVGKTANFECF